MRKDVPLEETWDLTLLFRNREEYEEERAKARRKAEEIRALKGTINTAEMINKAVDLYQEYYTSLSLVLNYSELASSVDYYDQKAQEDYGWDRMLLSELEGMTSFLKDEISSNSEEVLREAAEKSESNRTFISDILREKPHRLKEEGEEILSLLSPVLETPYETYNMAKLADMTFPSFTVEGTTYPLGDSLFEDDYQYEKDTGIRRTAFKEFSSVIRKYENTTASLYNAQCRKEKILSSLKGFDSVFDYLLFPQKVTREMYDRQIDLIMDKLSPHMRRYARLKKKVLGLKEMTYPDLLVPLDSDYSPSVTWKECEHWRAFLS